MSGPPPDPGSELSADATRELLGKGWLTHDAMWFDQAVLRFGIEAANDLNRAAIRAMAPFEVRRLLAAQGFDSPPRDAAAVARFVHDGVRLSTPGSVSGRLRVTSGGGPSLCWEWDAGECFAFKGMARSGHLDGYRCGVIYRIQCWLDALGAEPLGDPAIERCVMRVDGRCSGEIALSGTLSRPR